jgi:hypothetical protein
MSFDEVFRRYRRDAVLLHQPYPPHAGRRTNSKFGSRTNLSASGGAVAVPRVRFDFVDAFATGSSYRSNRGAAFISLHRPDQQELGRPETIFVETLREHLQD